MLALPAIFLLCIAAVQAMRRHWHNALTAFLGALVFALWFAIDSHNCSSGSIAQARLTQIRSLQREVEILKLEIDDLLQAPNGSTNNLHADH